MRHIFFFILLWAIPLTIPALDFKIVLPEQPSPAEQTAKAELEHYLARAVEGKIQVDGKEIEEIHLGMTVKARESGYDNAGMPPDSWRLQSSGDTLFIYGGGNAGTLYGAYAFLENRIGVHWWTPHEEYVPEKQSYHFPALNDTWQPKLTGRDIYRHPELLLPDGGRFAARNRLNRDGDLKIYSSYGGSSADFGSPYHIHTFNWYIPEQYVKTNPEYFALYRGKREAGMLGQLCLSNENVYQLILKKLQEFILADEKYARENQLPLPRIYDLSPNDAGFACECKTCHAVNEAEKSEMGTLLRFVNRAAREISVFRPELIISTPAYVNTIRPPALTRPEKNVMIRLCDNGTIGLPLSAPENSSFLELVKTWNGITQHLYVWLYSITYRGHGFPFASELFMDENVRLLTENGVKYLFWEHEDPDIGDMYALKIWLEAKLSENPDADADQLTRTFIDKYYGEAGEYILTFRRSLLRSIEKIRNPIPIMGGIENFDHMTYPVVRQGHELFDQAEAAVKSDAVRLQRVREARMGLDRYTLLGVQKLVKEFLAGGGTLEQYPFDTALISSRVQQTYARTLDHLRPDKKQQLLSNLEGELKTAVNIPRLTTLPAQFIGYSGDELFDITAEKISRHNPELEVVKDAGAESGFAVRRRTTPDKPELPLLFGMYAWNSKQLFSGYLKAEDIKKPDYNWYKLGSAVIPNDSVYVYFLSDWTIQAVVSDVGKISNNEIKYDIWASIKFSGPAYPHGGKGENGVYVERVILTKNISITQR